MSRPNYAGPEDFENALHTRYAEGILKKQQPMVILDLSLRKTQSGKSRDFRDVIVFESYRF